MSFVYSQPFFPFLSIANLREEVLYRSKNGSATWFLLDYGRFRLVFSWDRSMYAGFLRRDEDGKGMEGRQGDFMEKVEVEMDVTM